MAFPTTWPVRWPNSGKIEVFRNAINTELKKNDPRNLVINLGTGTTEFANYKLHNDVLAEYGGERGTELQFMMALEDIYKLAFREAAQEAETR